ncbi:serum response factor-binding protein 1-like [Myzus persicae]|uniref:serum response factor-binding protein 1-like n=1 Tax=Myzus persicae TaxID=13164 RepID=UPI000B938FE8|nr:serum response factor-binding protein 1-like [Myzus persicae]
MELLSKLSLNNQIVTMRHIVRKSKVHTIHKLTREAKKLKEKKGNEEQLVKNKKKAERFISELMVIKKLNDDDVTKYALQNEVPSATILNSIDITLETRALARLAGHKFITDEVQKFRSKYPDWKLCITDLLNELGAKYRAKKKPIKNKSVKTEIKTKILTKNNNKIKNMREFEYAQSESDGVQSEPEDHSVSDGVQSEPEDHSVSEGAQSEPEDQSVSDGAQSEPEDQSVSGDAQSEHEDQSVFGGAQSESEDQSMSDGAQSEPEDQSESKNTSKSDSLFLQKIMPHENNSSNDEHQNNVSRDSKISNNKEMFVKNKEEYSSTLDKSLLNSQVKTDVLNTQLPKKSSHSSTNEILDNIDKNVSKRKAKQSISSKVDSKKKRITANEIKPVCETVDSFFMTVDNKDYMSVYKPPPVTERVLEEHTKVEYQKPVKEFFSKGKKVIVGKQNNMGNRRERRQQQVEECVDTTLHPSWEAKRKQKSLAKFEGKKITFDDDED